MATLSRCRGVVARQLQLRAAWARCLSQSQPVWNDQANSGAGDKKADGGAAVGDEEGTAAADTGEDLTALLKAKEEDIAALTKEMQDNRMRALADKENLRKAKDNEISNAKDFGISKFSKDLLLVADTVDLAIQHAPMDEINKEVPQGSPPPAAKVMYEGLLSINTIMQKTFAKHGLNTIRPEVGTELDPHTMQAMFQLKVEGQEPGTVAVVQQVGYKLNSRVLRPSMVGVVEK